MTEAKIVCDPNILVGKPTIKGTRISVELILDCFTAGWSRDEIFEAYPFLDDDQINACLSYARNRLPTADVPSAAE